VSQFYLPKQESEFVKSQPEGYLLALVRKEMSPAAEVEVAKAEPPPAAFVPAKPNLLSGSALFHPQKS
jgi:hypothetical protein